MAHNENENDDKLKINNKVNVSNDGLKTDKSVILPANNNVKVDIMENKITGENKTTINLKPAENLKKESANKNKKALNANLQNDLKTKKAEKNVNDKLSQEVLKVYDEKTKILGSPLLSNKKTTEPIVKNKHKVFSDSGLQGKKAKVLKKDNTSKLLLGLSAISLVLIMVVMGQFFILESKDPSNTLYNGTIINGVNVGGMSIYEAEELIYDIFKEKSNNFKMELTYKDKSWTFDKNDFKVNSQIHTIIEEAQAREIVNKSYNNQIDKLEELKKEGVAINVAFNYIFVGLDDKIDKIIKEIEIEPVNSEITFDANSKNVFKISEHKNGLRVNKEQLYFDINEQFNKSNTVTVEIPTIVEEPKVTKEYNESVTKEVSSFTTYVSDSTGARKSNVKLALDKFNGLVIKPNEEVSFNKITGPHSVENGYKVATVIYNGQFVDGVGGGICQASTTLYNSLILSNVEILEVHKHTLPVKYVPLGLDAMVSEYVADLKFKNTSEYPIYIVTSSNAESVNVKIYSHELENQIKSKAEVVKTLPHSGDEIKFDEAKEYTDKVLFKGEQFRLTYPRDGYEAVAYLEYFKNGELVETKQIRHEIYAPQKGLIIEGIEEVPAGMTIIDGKVEKIEASEEASAMNNNNPTGLIPTNVCP